MTETQPFANLIQDAVHAALNPTTIEKLIEKHVEQLVSNAVSEAFGSWSGTGKQITAVVKESLQVKDLNLPAYGGVVAEIVRRAVDARVSELVAAKLTSDLDNILGLAPKRIKLSDLVAELVGPEGEEQNSHGVTCDVTWNDQTWAKIRISAKNAGGYHDVDVDLHIRLTKEQAKYARGENPDGTISFGHVSGSDLKKGHFYGYGNDRRQYSIGRLYSFEQRILALYACEAVIEIDEDDVVTERDY